jgi:hypothetical protein
MFKNINYISWLPRQKVLNVGRELSLCKESLLRNEASGYKIPRRSVH